MYGMSNTFFGIKRILIFMRCNLSRIKYFIEFAHLIYFHLKFIIRVHSLCSIMRVERNAFNGYSLFHNNKS